MKLSFTQRSGSTNCRQTMWLEKGAVLDILKADEREGKQGQEELHPVACTELSPLHQHPRLKIITITGWTVSFPPGKQLKEPSTDTPSMYPQQPHLGVRTKSTPLRGQGIPQSQTGCVSSMRERIGGYSAVSPGPPVFTKSLFTEIFCTHFIFL